MYAGTPERLAIELSSRRRRPRAVYLSPSTDPFPPQLGLQLETARVVEVLARHEVQSWLMTRGYIRPAVLEALAAFRRHAKITIGLTTLDRSLQRTLEPLAAPPRLLLRQIRELRERDLNVQVALEPLIPGITDTRKNLVALLDALAHLGIEHISTSYLFLRPAIRDNLLVALEKAGLADTLSDEFSSGPILTAPGLSPARYLPRARRQRGYAAVMALAAERGITVGISSMTNPDFPAARPALPEASSRQPTLPMFASACNASH
jgi:DNA repair photolyase